MTQRRVVATSDSAWTGVLATLGVIAFGIVAVVVCVLGFDAKFLVFHELLDQARGTWSVANTSRSESAYWGGVETVALTLSIDERTWERRTEAGETYATGSLVIDGEPIPVKALYDRHSISMSALITPLEPNVSHEALPVFIAIRDSALGPQRLRIYANDFATPTENRGSFALDVDYVAFSRAE